MGIKTRPAPTNRMMRILSGTRCCSALLVAGLLGGCGDTETVASLVTSVDGHESNGSLFYTGNWCVPIVGDKHDIGSNTFREQFGLHSYTSAGQIYQALYIRPPGEFLDPEVTDENGELAMEWTFTPDDIPDGEWETEEIETHHGESMWISHWLADPGCEQPNPPEGFEYPGL